MADTALESTSSPSVAKPQAAPYPGTHEMPRWNVGELIDAPKFTARNWFAMLGPGLLMGGAAIGGGEWLVGPIVTAKYGGAMLWLATLSILGQVIYNIEISRYTLYSGEPIFNGKFRTLPGPRFWVFVYIALDFGMVFPYLAANAATPLASVMLGAVPDPTNSQATATILGLTMTHKTLLRVLGYLIFLASMLPLIFGGKIYNALKGLMTFKIVVVFGFLVIVAIGWSTWGTWGEIFSGFFRFGNVPIPSEKGAPGQTVNVFVSIFSGDGFPKIDWSLIAFLSALVAISGSGGLSNTPISNYTRDQGWGMGHHVGAIGSVIGGHDLQLSHVGTVFIPNEHDESMPRWRRWYKHVVRDQMVVWMPACFLGLALPSMLSVQFLKRGTEVDNNWTAAAMTAEAVRGAVAGTAEFLGPLFWFMTLFCGFLVLAPSMSTSADGFIRRWVDVFWTSSRKLQKVDPKNIRYVYFAVLVVYVVFGMIMLSLEQPTTLLTIATTIFNFALGISCWHTLAVNTILLPERLRPNWFVRISLALTGAFFLFVATVAALQKVGAL
jgi:hypothetical protein